MCCYSTHLLLSIFSVDFPVTVASSAHIKSKIQDFYRIAFNFNAILNIHLHLFDFYFCFSEGCQLYVVWYWLNFNSLIYIYQGNGCRSSEKKFQRKDQQK